MEGTLYFCESLDGHIWSPSKTWANYVVLQYQYNLLSPHSMHISEDLWTSFSLVTLPLNECKWHAEMTEEKDPHPYNFIKSTSRLGSSINMKEYLKRAARTVKGFSYYSEVQQWLQLGHLPLIRLHSLLLFVALEQRSVMEVVLQIELQTETEEITSTKLKYSFYC